MLPFFLIRAIQLWDGILNFQRIGYNVTAISSLLLPVAMLKMASKLVILNSNIQMLKLIFEFVLSFKVNIMLFEFIDFVLFGFTFFTLKKWTKQQQKSAN